MKTGVVDVGGGLRGAYATAIFDYCQDNEISFDCCIGVSAGSANLASFLSHQRSRNFRFYTDYLLSKEAMSLQNKLKTGSYINFDYVYTQIPSPNGKDPFDYEAFAANPSKFYIVAANALTGEARYFTKDEVTMDDTRAFMASCAIPVINKPIIIDDIPYYDGAMAEPVPIKKAFEEGCDRVLLILTRPLNIQRKPGIDPAGALILKRKYPQFSKSMKNRANKYNECVSFAKERTKNDSVLILAPDNIDGMSTLSQNPEGVKTLYEKGYKDAAAIKGWLNTE